MEDQNPNQFDEAAGALGGGSLGTESGCATCCGGVTGLLSATGLGLLVSSEVEVVVGFCCSVVGALDHQPSQPAGGPSPCCGAVVIEAAG